MLIFHVAEKSRWDAARLAGSYAQSTLGRTLDDEGFIHAAREDQWRDVLDRYYRDFGGSLVLLTIDTEKLSSPWREEPVGDESFPHILGPLNPGAVVDITPIPRKPASTQPAVGARPGADATRPRTVMQEFIAEARFRMIAATCVMVFAAACGFVAIYFWGDAAGLPGLTVGLVIGAVAWWAAARRRDSAAETTTRA